ncbi:MAG: anthranilate phosphoribosyltransferase [Crenarchaeota archaeon]|nr:anthranilate phosphoribosyltransferase [Thermoproteota archaeon]
MIVNRLDVPEDLMYRVALLVLRGEIEDVLVSGLLVGLRVKGEAVSEICGFARAMYDSCVKVDVGDLDPIDTAGTGGDGLGTVNASTMAGLVASCVDGVYVLKHGNRSVSSSSGSADFLEALGFRVELSPDAAVKLLRSVRFSFLYAPLYHPMMRNVMKVRRTLKIRTIFNILGPLCNPGGVKRQVIGVSSRELMYRMAETCVRLGKTRILVVHGEPGIDEVSVFGRTHVVEVRDGKIEEYDVDVSDLGLKKWRIEDVKVTGPGESVKLFLNALDEKRGPVYEFILANTAAALYVAGVVSDLRDGVELAREVIEDGLAFKHVMNVVNMSKVV